MLLHSFVKVILTIVMAILNIALSAVPVAVKSYTCDKSTGACLLHKGAVAAENATAQSTCLLTCGGGALWPYPTGYVSIEDDVSAFIFDQLTVHFGAQSESDVFAILTTSMRRNFLDQVTAMRPTGETRSSLEGSVPLSVFVEVQDTSITVATLHIDESYSLEIVKEKQQQDSGVLCIISAKTAFGARHGMETLLQLIAYDELLSSLVVASHVQILDDKPQFPYRGALIDMSRSFVPIKTLENVARAMVVCTA